MNRPGPAPSLRTSHLLLRPFRASEAARLCELAGDKQISDTMQNLPYPYTMGHAQAFIGTQALRHGFAIAQLGTDALLGAIGLKVEPGLRCAELGYWVGRPFWGHGVATQAATKVLAYGFSELGLLRIFAFCMASNAASRAVLRRAGLAQESLFCRPLVKDGVAHDVVVYSATSPLLNTKA